MNSSGGVTGAAFVANAKPDGYTLLLGWVASIAISPAFYSEIPYSWDDFDHLTIVQKHPFVLAGGTESELKTFEALEKSLKTGKENILFASLAPSTLNTIAPELMFSLMDVPLERARFVPFDSGANAVTALIGNHADFLWQGSGPLAGAIEGKQVNCLAVTSSQRLSIAPNCPTVRELGYTELESMTSWGSISGPKGLPQEVIDAWSSALAKVAQDPKWIADLKSIEGIPAIVSPEEATAFVEEQYKLFKELQDGKE